MAWLLEIIQSYQLSFVLAFILTAFATPLAAMVAKRAGVMDMPDRFLKPHARPTPYLGGTAICLGWSAAVLLALFRGQVTVGLILPLLAGGIAMSALGLLDDIRNISPKLRLICGAIIIAAALLLTGTGMNLVDSVVQLLHAKFPTTEAWLIVPRWLSTPVSLALSVFIVLGACNSTNLIDGLDGLCTGVTAIIALGFALLATILASYQPNESGHPVRLVVSIALLGATLGFLPMNFNPARIFMGDAGSVLLGYNCGILILLFAEWGNPRWVIGALMIFALPVFDTALAMIRRWRSGRSIFEGDRSHFYDQLVQRGLTVRQTVLVCYGLTLGFALIGLLVIWLRIHQAVLIYLFVCALIAVILWRAGMFTPEGRRSASPRAPAGS